MNVIRNRRLQSALKEAVDAERLGADPVKLGEERRQMEKRLAVRSRRVQGQTQHPTHPKPGNFNGFLVPLLPDTVQLLQHGQRLLRGARLVAGCVALRCACC